MKNVVIGFSFAVLASTFAVGCTSSDDTTGDDGGGDPCDNLQANVSCSTANWKFVTANDDATVSNSGGCPDGFNTGVVISVSEDDTGSHDIGACLPNSTSTSTCVLDLYDCDALTGHDTLPDGYWAQAVAITTEHGASVYATSIFDFIDVTGNSTYNAEIVDNGGYYLASWHLVDGGGADVDCADVANQNGVEISGTLVSDANVLIPDDFDCDKGEYGFQYSSPIPAGTYTMHVDLLDDATPTPGSLGSGDVPNVTIGDRNDVQDLGDIEITVD